MQVFGFPGTLPHELNESPPQPAAEAAHTAIEDRSEARFRVESIDIGIRLTLLTAAIAVPFNVLFGICASWAIARFDFSDSLPPRRMHALPDLMHRPPASAVTFGRDS